MPALQVRGPTVSTIDDISLFDFPSEVFTSFGYELIIACVVSFSVNRDCVLSTSYYRPMGLPVSFLFIIGFRVFCFVLLFGAPTFCLAVYRFVKFSFYLPVDIPRLITFCILCCSTPLYWDCAAVDGSSRVYGMDGIPSANNETVSSSTAKRHTCQLLYVDSWPQSWTD